MEFLSADVAALARPTEEELGAYLDARPAMFRVDSRCSFSQVFLDRQAQGGALEAQAAKLLAALEAPGSTLDTQPLGDSRMLPARLDDAARSDVEAQFGAGFAAHMEELEPGRWHWPVESAYGPHLVRVERRTAGRAPAPVEAAIALSIVFVAGEILQRGRGRSGLTLRWPWSVSFTFGLLHGLGFAGALHEVGLPQHYIPVALAFFSFGVELGQLAFVAAVLLTLGAGRRALEALRTRAGLPLPPAAALETVCAYGIGGMAAFWLVERTVNFLP
jgi:hypothetical protein